MKRVLITGGSEGIGYQLALLFAEEDCHLILNGRNEEKLKQAARVLQDTYPVEVEIAVKDLSVRGSAEELYEQVKPLDVLVNNAGCGYAGRTWESEPDREEAMVHLNDASLMTLSRLFIKDHVKTKDGMLVNVASTGAFQPGPYIASYYASKSFVVSYTKAIAQEVKDYGIKVHCLCPGPVDTGFYEKSGGHHPSSAMSSEECAAYAYQRFGKNRVMIIPGFANQIVRFVPEYIRMLAVGRMKKKYLK